MDKYLFPIDITIYEFTGRVYDFLMDIARIRVFDNEQIQEFARNLYVVIGIVMIFKVVIILLSIVINPARAFHEKEGTAGPAASRIIVVIVLILTVPLVFSLAYSLQNAILEENVIPKIITGIVGNNDLGEFIKDEAELCVYEPINLNRTYGECMSDPICGVFDSYESWYREDFNYSPVWPFDNDWSRLTTNDMVVTDLAFETFYSQFYIDNTLLSDLGGTNAESKYRRFLNPELPIQYDLGLSYRENSITFLVNGGNEKINFFRNRNSKTHYSKKVCRPFAMIAYNSKEGMLDIAFSETYDRDLPLFGSEFNNAGFKLVDWKTSENVVTYTLTPGKIFSISILRNFLELSDETPEDAADIELADAAVSEGNFTKLEDIMLESFNRRTSQHNYILIISTLVGFGLLFLLVSLCFDMALRIIKLGFLQLTAPIPITSYISGSRGDSKTFNNWVKVCLTTYTDVFIRVAALSFASFVLHQLTQHGIINYEEIYSDGSGEWILKLFVIFGALSFVKILPKILAEIFGSDISGSGNILEFNPFRKMQEVPLVGAGIGLGVGAAGGLIGGAATGKGFFGRTFGAIRGTFTGGFRGAQQVPLAGFNPGDKVPLGQTLTPFTAGYKGYKRAEVGNRVAQANSAYRQARRESSAAQTRYETAQETGTNAETAHNTATGWRDTSKKIYEAAKNEHQYYDDELTNSRQRLARLQTELSGAQQDYKISNNKYNHYSSEKVKLEQIISASDKGTGPKLELHEREKLSRQIADYEIKMNQEYDKREIAVEAAKEISEDVLEETRFETMLTQHEASSATDEATAYTQYQTDERIAQRVERNYYNPAADELKQAEEDVKTTEAKVDEAKVAKDKARDVKNKFE